MSIDVYGFDFDGSTYLTLTNSLQYLTESDFTIMFVCKLTKNDNNPWNTILATQNNSVNNGYSIRVSASENGINYLNFSDEFSDGEQQIIAEIPSSIDVGSVLNISYQYDSSDVLNSKWMINGVDVANTITNIKSGTRSTSEETWIGKMISFGDLYFIDGALSSLKIFDSYLTDAEILEEMDENILPTIGYWPLNQNTLDYSGNANTGIVNGTEQYTVVYTIGDDSKTMIEKKDTFTNFSTSIKEVIHEYIYGGLISFVIVGGGNKTFTIAGYDDSYDRKYYEIIDSFNTSDSTIEIELPDKPYRRFAITIEGDAIIGGFGYTISDEFDLLSHSESIQANSYLQDSYAFYLDTSVKTLNYSFKVPKSLKTKAQTLLSNKVYLDGVEMRFLNEPSMVEFDNNNISFECTFTEVVNE